MFYLYIYIYTKQIFYEKKIFFFRRNRFSVIEENIFKNSHLKA